MKAAVFYGVGDIRIEEVPEPSLGPGEALLKVGAAGICGTDIRIFTTGHHRIPQGTRRILGHEFAGEIVAVGEGVSGLSPGMRVAVAPNIGCGVCPECIAGWTNLCEDYRAFGISLDGAFAEYLRIPTDAIRQGNVVPLPSSVPFDVAALAEPLSCCLNGQEAVRVGPGDGVLIIGAGPIGIMHLLLARLAGARYVVMSEVHPLRLEQARAHGADLVVNPQEQDLRMAVMEISDGRGADVVIVAAPIAEGQQQALELAARRGRINFFGGLPKDQPYATLNTNLIHYRQLVVTGTTGSNVRQFRVTVDLLAAKRIRLDSLITTRLGLDQIAEGFSLSRLAQEMRIIILPYI